MWIQKDKRARSVNWDEVLDWVVIEGVLWVEVLDEAGGEVCTVQC